VVPKISTSGASIRSALEYDQASKNGEPPGEWVAGTLIGTAREMARQCSIFRQLRPDCKKAIWSCSLSLPPTDGRREASEWGQIAESFLQKMGVDIKTHGWAAHQHEHENSHIHIRLCRIGADGRLWNQEHSARRAIKICAELEGEFHLESHNRTPAKKKRLSMAEEQIFIRKGIQMSRATIQKEVDSIIAAHPQGIDFAELQALLKAARQIDIQPYAPGGVLKGVSYLLDSVKWPGSKIGSNYSAGLTGRGVRYSVEVPQADTPPSELVATSRSEPKRSLVQQQIHGVQPAKWRLDTSKAAAEQYIPGSLGPVFQACLLLSAEAINLMASLFEKILAFLNSILRRIGIGVVAGADDRHGNQLVLVPNEPNTPIDLEARLVENAAQTQIAHAAQTINQVAAAVTNRDPSLLPAGPGREELVAAMANEFAEQGSAEEKGPFAFMPHGDQEHDQVVPTPSPFSLFLAAKAKHFYSQTMLKNAMNSDELGKPNVEDIWAPTREDRELAVKVLRAANERLQQVRSNSKTWVNHSVLNKIAAKIWSNPHDEAERKAQAQVAKLTAELKELGAEKQRYTQVEIVSILAAQQAEKAAAAAVHSAKTEVIAAARSALKIADGVLSAVHKTDLLLSLQKAGHDEVEIREALAAIWNEVQATRLKIAFTNAPQV
jgi:hypothetical protein